VGEGYRLKTLFELREREEEARKGELARAVEQATEARRALAAAEEKRADARRVEDARVDRGEASVGDVEGGRRWLERLAEAVAAARERAIAAEAAERAAREALAAAVRERQAIEKHRERWLAEEQRDRDRREEAALDDLANRRK
jgi:flagellar export protein FliJ